MLALLFLKDKYPQYAIGIAVNASITAFKDTFQLYIIFRIARKQIKRNICLNIQVALLLSKICRHLAGNSQKRKKATTS